MLKFFLIKMIIRFSSQNPEEFTRLLAKLEYGISSCLRNLSVEAEKDNYPNLALMLRNHAKSEHNHGKMLATLADGRSRIKMMGSGRWLSLINESGKELIENASEKKKNSGKLVNAKIRGQQCVGIFENFDGLSQKYLSLRLLLENNKMLSLPWCSRIACMAVLELETKNFYEELGKSSKISEPLKMVVSKIASDEESHADYLNYVLLDFTSLPRQEIDKWQERLTRAYLGLIFDFARLSWSKYKKMFML